MDRTVQVSVVAGISLLIVTVAVVHVVLVLVLSLSPGTIVNRTKYCE